MQAVPKEGEPKELSTGAPDGELRSAPRSPWRNLGINLLLVIVGILFALAMFEGALRVAAVKTDAGPAWNDRPKRIYLPPNSPDNRNAPYDMVKPANTFRIVVVGDSFTYGGKVQIDDNFAKRLERMLNLDPQGKRVEVLNWGTPGYSTAREELLVRRAIAHYSPDLVVLQVTLNDPELEPFRSRKGGIQERWNTLSESWLVRHVKLLSFIGNRVVATLSHREYRAYYLDLFRNPRTWNHFANATEKIAKRASDAHVPLVAMVFPLLSHPLDQRYPFEEIHRKIHELYGSIGLHYLDLRPIFSRIPPERLQAIPGIDDHPNEIAHRMAADELYRTLVDRDLLPKELRIRDMRRGRRANDKVYPFGDRAN